MNLDWAREVAKLWNARRRNPHQVPKQHEWVYPFYLPAEILGRSVVADRLAVEVARSATRYARAIAEVATVRDLLEADESLRLQADALRVWGRTHATWQQYEGNDVWGGIPPKAHRLVGPDPMIAYAERAKRLREPPP